MKFYNSENSSPDKANAARRLTTCAVAMNIETEAAQMWLLAIAARITGTTYSDLRETLDV